MGVSLQTLQNRRTVVLQGMSNSRQRILDLEGRLSRLQQASDTLNGQIGDLTNIKNKVNNLQIDDNMWKGEEKSKFDDHYDQYKTITANYIKKTETAKNDIDEEITRTQTNLSYAETGLANLKQTLRSLDTQIRLAEKE